MKLIVFCVAALVGLSACDGGGPRPSVVPSLTAEGNIGEPARGEINADSALQAIGNCTPDSYWGTSESGAAARVFELVNEHRQRIGIGGVSPDLTLQNSAIWKAMHMAGYGYMQHNDPAPPAARSVAQRLQACGYTRGSWGENIAFGYRTPDEVMRGWLNSPGHRANIENPAFTRLGVGAARNSSQVIYWSQNFGVAR